MDPIAPPRSPATRALLFLASFLTTLSLVSAVRSALTAAGVLDAQLEPALREEYAAVGVLDEYGLRVSEGVAAVVTVPVAVTCLIVVLGLFAWKEWAREGALGVFGLLGLFLLVMSLTGLVQDPPARQADLGVLASLVVLSVAALAYSAPVQRDFERREIARNLRERRAATAARQARAEQAQSHPQAGSPSSPSGAPSR